MRPVLVGMSGAQLPRAFEQLERARVPAAGPRHAVEPRHGLGVVIQHVGPRVEHGAQRRFVALEIRDQHFDAALGPPRLDRANGRGERAGAEVRRGRRDRPT